MNLKMKPDISRALMSGFLFDGCLGSRSHFSRDPVQPIYPRHGLASASREQLVPAA